MFETLFKYSREDYARSDLIITGDWPTWMLVLLVTAAVAGISWLLYRRRGFVQPHQMLAVWVLQLVMLAAVIWVLQQPTLATEQLRAGDNAVAFVLDNSESMAYGEAAPRLQQALHSLSTALGEDSALDLSVQHYELSDRARPVDSFLESEPSGTETSIAASLTDVLRQARSSPLAAIVLSSDGADTSGGLSPAALAEIAGFGVPVHSIPVGRETMPEDIELTDVTLPGKALPGSTLTARVSIRHDAPASTRLKVYNGDNPPLVSAHPDPVTTDNLHGPDLGKGWLHTALAWHLRRRWPADGRYQPQYGYR